MKNSKLLTLLLTLSIGSVALLWGCGDDGTNPLAPVAGFSFTVDEATGGTVTFSNTSENATNYAWDFGDGNTSTDENPENTYAANGDYTVELVASNDAGTSSTSSETIAIALIPVAGFSFMIDEATGGTVTFANTSENATSYAWDFGDGNTSTDENPENTYASNGDYTVELVASNDAGTSNSSSETLAISLIPVAGFSYEAVGNTVTFTNTSKNATSYAWDFGDGNTSTDENPVNTYAANDTYTATLEASNDAGTTHSFSMEIEITAATPNAAPVFANTSYSFNVASDATDGAVVGIVFAVDTDGDMLTYSLSGTDAGSFAISNTPVASGEEVSVTVATNADLPSLTSPVALTVEVSDGTDQVTANVEITIAAGNVAPVFDQTAYTFNVSEGAVSGAILGPVSATDSNAGDLLTYSLSGTDADHFAINNTPVASGTVVPVTVAASANLSSLTSPVTLIVTVADDETPALMATANAEITIIAGNVAPVFDQTAYTFTIASDAVEEAVLGPVSATDFNAGDLLTYSLSGTDAGHFEIKSGTDVVSGTAVSVTVASGANLPSLTSPVTLIVTVADDETPALMATANVEITIIAGNVAPVFDQTAYTFAVNEDAESGDVVDAVSATDSNAGNLLAYTISGEGADNFAIDHTAVASGTPVQITVSGTASLDHETTPSYTLEVQASDDDTPALTATAAVTINVNDVNDNDPVFAQASYIFSVDENSPASTVVDVVAATDADAGTTLAYRITTTQTDFEMDASTGEIKVASASLDFETTASYTLQVEASDGTKTATAEVTINVNDLNDNDPVFTGTPYTFNVDENSAVSTMVGTVVATDADAGTTLAYRITTTPTDFDIDSGTGEMTVASAVLDFETTPSYTLEVQASDGATSSAMTATAEVTINVNDLNDNDPVFGETAYTFEIGGANALSGDEVGTVAATDADAGATLEYSITNTQTEFDIDANTGIITVSDAATLSTATPSYTLMVQVDDGTNTAMANVTITILQPNYDADGDGLIDINTLEQLNAMRWDLDGNGEVATADADAYEAAFPDAATFATTPTGYELVRSLDFDAAGSYGSGALNTAWSTNTGTGWDPIGDFSINAANNAPFVAAFAGNDHTISNLYVNRSSESYVGLFGHVGAPGTVRDVGLLDVDITGNSNVGGLVGVNNNSGTGTIMIENSYATGTVTGDTNVGGLIGNSQNTSTGTVTIRACYAECTVMGIGDGVNVGTGDNVGGLVGLNSNSGTGTLLITACYATGNMTGTGEAVGGLVGQNDITSTSTILMTACYATGNVTGTGESVGGLVGQNLNRGTFTLTACYARGAVTGTVTFIGGLVGDNIFGTITASYFDFTINSGLTQGDEGKTTDELRMPTSYAGIYADWNVDLDGDDTADDPWDFGTADDYPVLKIDFNNDGSTADDVTRQRQ